MTVVYIILATILLILAVKNYKKFMTRYMIYKLSKETWKYLNEKNGRNDPFREVGDVDDDEGYDEK